MATLKTPEAILSYVTLFTPRAASEDADAKYSCAFVFEADANLTALKKAAIQTAKEKYGSKLEGAKITTLDTQFGPANFLVKGTLRIRMPWRDHPEDIASKGYPEGSTFFNARSPQPVGVVATFPDPSNDNKPAQIVNAAGDIRYKDGTLLPAARPVYSGVIGRGLVSVFAYDQQGNKGVSFGLQGVQILRDGERLDGRANAEDQFDADMESAPDLDDLVGATASAEEDDLSDLLG